MGLTGAIIAMTAAMVGGQIATYQSAKKRAASLDAEAARVRSEELERAAETQKKADALATQAETVSARAKEAAITAGLRKKRRTTIATGPRGLLDESSVTKPTLLGS